MEKFKKLFNLSLNSSVAKPAVIGMIHLLPLPGTPSHAPGMTVAEISQRACKEVKLYMKYGLDGIMIENMHDVPYTRGQVGPEIVSSITRIATDIKSITNNSTPLGIQILSAANKEALAVAHSVGAQFIRAESFVYSHIGDEGWTDSCAGELLRYRKYIGAEDVLIWSDVKKKHSSHAITSDISLSDTVTAAQFFKSDAIIVTGTSTGKPTAPTDFTQALYSTHLPVLIGSGVTRNNVHEYSGAAGFIIGSHFKVSGLWYNTIDEQRLAEFCETMAIKFH